MIRLLCAATAVFAMAAGCANSSDNHAAESGSGGSGGSSGALNCRALSDTGTDCYCSSHGSNTLSECSGDSVASTTDDGYCCSGGGFCTCFRTACVTLASIGFCECGSPVDDTSPRVDTCHAQAGGTCCLDTGLYPFSCHCSDAVASCPAGETPVASCALADVMHCRSDETVVDRCK